MASKWFGGALGRRRSDTLEDLAELARNKTAVRIEVENSQIRFNSQLTLKRGMVVIAKPPGLREGFGTESFVRVRAPHAGRRQMRMKVMSPHVNLANGNAVFICEAPVADVASRRASERFDVTRYNNLRLVTGGEEFRLLDVSESGLRAIANATEAAQYFPLGKEVGPAHLKLGTKVRVDLAKVVPRSHQRSAVGCEFSVKHDPAAERYLAHLLDSLKQAEQERLMKLA